MRDQRLDKFAEVLVGYSTRIKAGDLVVLKGEPQAMPLLEAVYERLIQAGAHVRFVCTPESFREIFLRQASEAQLTYLNDLEVEEIKRVDARISIGADVNTRAFTSVDAWRQGMASAAQRPIMKIFMERAANLELRWCGTLFPTAANAQDAEMSLREYEDFVFAAGHLDAADPAAAWLRIEKRQQRVVDYLNGKQQVRFRADNGTDLTVNVSGMTWINCAGRENFPDGEVFTGPNLRAEDGGVNGYVRFSFPAVHKGREVEGVELAFEKGRVVEARASKNEAYLKEMLEMDDGASAVGEIAIGTNYQIQRFTKNTLFDEKIGGTFHLAVGAGYPETGNSNDSGLHWDMVCDMRTGGTIEADGELFQKDGRFVTPGWPGIDEEA